MMLLIESENETSRKHELELMEKLIQLSAPRQVPQAMYDPSQQFYSPASSYQGQSFQQFQTYGNQSSSQYFLTSMLQPSANQCSGTNSAINYFPDRSTNSAANYHSNSSANSAANHRSNSSTSSAANYCSNSSTNSRESSDKFDKQYSLSAKK